MYAVRYAYCTYIKVALPSSSLTHGRCAGGSWKKYAYMDKGIKRKKKQSTAMSGRTLKEGGAEQQRIEDVASFRGWKSVGNLPSPLPSLCWFFGVVPFRALLPCAPASLQNGNLYLFFLFLTTGSIGHFIDIWSEK